MTIRKGFYFFITCLISMQGISCKKASLKFSNVTKLDSHCDHRFNDIYFNGNDGFAVGGNRFDNCTILVTHDGGNTWERKDFPQAGKALYGITETPVGDIVAIGYDGKMMTSKDKGYNWTFSQASSWQSYKDVAFLNDNQAIAISGNSYNSGGIVHMNRYGALSTWDSTAVEYNDIEMRDATSGYITGYGIVLKTTDAGKNWTQLPIENDNFKAIAILNAEEMWVCGVSGSIFHSKDAGASWDKQRNGNSLTIKKYHLNDLYFTDQSNGWAVGEAGVVIYSSDGGKNWKEYEHFTDDNLRSIYPAPGNSLVVCGDNGALYKLVK